MSSVPQKGDKLNLSISLSMAARDAGAAGFLIADSSAGSAFLCACSCRLRSGWVPPRAAERLRSVLFLNPFLCLRQVSRPVKVSRRLSDACRSCPGGWTVCPSGPHCHPRHSTHSWRPWIWQAWRALLPYWCGRAMYRTSYASGGRSRRLRPDIVGGILLRPSNKIDVIRKFCCAFFKCQGPNE